MEDADSPWSPIVHVEELAFIGVEKVPDERDPRGYRLVVNDLQIILLGTGQVWVGPSVEIVEVFSLF